jgi:hypothetical protein
LLFCLSFRSAAEESVSAFALPVLPHLPELVILSGVADAFVSNAVEGPAVVLVAAEMEQKRDVPLAYNDGYDARTLRELLEIVEANKERIERAWNEFFR